MVAAGSHVAVVDDVREYAETAASILDEAGLVPSVISEGDGVFQSTDQLVERVQSAGCSAVVCDHRLRPAGLASFTGAEFVSRLYRRNIPAVLLSTFSAIDGDASIRLYRSFIPSLLDRSHLDPERVLNGLKRCAEELEGYTVPERQPRRTMVRVVGVSTEGDSLVADAILHSWDPDRAIRFPLELIEDSRIRDLLPVNFSGALRLFAQVNVGCREDHELFFRAFELAPDPTVDDLAT